MFFQDFSHKQTQIFCLWSTMPVIKIHKTYAFPRKNNVMLVTIPVTYLLPVFFTESFIIEVFQFFYHSLPCFQKSNDRFRYCFLTTFHMMIKWPDLIQRSVQIIMKFSCYIFPDLFL